MSRAACEALARDLGVDAAELVELWNERAAIREYDGGQPRDEAEAAALDDVREIAAHRVLADSTRRGPRASTIVTEDAGLLTADRSDGKS